MSRLDDLVAAADLDGLVREVDHLCAARAWADLFTLVRRCRAAAVETGRQLWPAANHAEYRIALEGDPAAAARAVLEGSGRFGLGPLPEVAASTHSWADLAPHLDGGPRSALLAHECVVRGDRVTGGADDLVDILPLPYRLEPWEPRYARAEYRAHEADFPRPDVPVGETVDLAVAPPRLTDDDAVEALRHLVHVWVRESDGRVDVAAVEGDVAGAVAALGPRRVRLAPITAGHGLALMGWAAASGGAHGPRPGAATGRSAAWWAAAALAGLDGDGAEQADALGQAVGELRWLVWDAGEPDTGWSLRLAVEDAADGLAWAITAADAA